MIADSPRNRIVARACVTIVTAVSPVSVAVTLYAVLFRRDLLTHFKDPLSLLFGWCLAESLFWGWWILTYKSRSLEFARVIPSFEERQKLKEDCLWIIESSPDGAKEFLEGWFKGRKRKARIEDLRQDNIKDWYLPAICCAKAQAMLGVFFKSKCRNRGRSSVTRRDGRNRPVNI
jgi:hypothetical protein